MDEIRHAKTQEVPQKPERFTQQQTRLVILRHDDCTVMFDMCHNQLLAAAKKGLL